MDYDGTLTHFHQIPEFTRPTAGLLSTLKALSDQPDVYFYILSGRPRMHLEKWFSELDIGLCAEHGCFYRQPLKVTHVVETQYEKDRGWTVLVDALDLGHANLTWRDTIRPLLEHFTERTPGSFIEEKEVNLTWHYRNADPDFGSWQAAELQVNLEKILSHMPVSIVKSIGNKTVELRPSTVDKGTAVKAILRELGQDVDFLLCLGDGKTDEVVFQLLNEQLSDSITATVGKKQTEASFYVENVHEVEELFKQLM